MFFGKSKVKAKISFEARKHFFSYDGRYLRYQHRFGKSFRILAGDIESVSLDKEGMLTSRLVINGKGTRLAELKLNRIYAEKTQDFIYNEIIEKRDQ